MKIVTDATSLPLFFSAVLHHSANNPSCTSSLGLHASNLFLCSPELHLCLRKLLPQTLILLCSRHILLLDAGKSLFCPHHPLLKTRTWLLHPWLLHHWLLCNRTL
jgi:hypothetical protein